MANQYSKICFIFLFLSSICFISCLRQKPRMRSLPGTASLSLQCDVPEVRYHDDPIHVTWFHDGEMIQMGGIFSMDEEYGLLSRLVTEQQRGTYQCRVSSKDSVITGRKVRIDLIYPYFAAPLGAKTAAVLHSDIKLQCVIIEDGRGIYNRGTPKWMFNDTQHVKNQHCRSKSRSQSCKTISADNTLLIKNIQWSDAGKYTCQYVWDGGVRARTPMSMDTQLTVYRTPSFLLQWPTKLDVDSGSNLTLSCKIDEPTEQYMIEWHKDRVNLPTYHHTVINDSLHIEGITRQDSGVYSCIVTTQKPVRTTLRQTTYINVKSPPLAITIWVEQLSMTLVNVSWRAGENGGYAIDSFGFSYIMIDENGHPLDHEQEPFLLSKHLKHTEIEALVANRSYRITMWANNALGTGEKTSVVFDTFPGDFHHIFSASTASSIVEQKNEPPLSLGIIIGTTSVTSLVIVVATALCTVGVLILYRKHCGADSDRARRQYRIPEDNNADESDVIGIDDNNNSSSSGSHLGSPDDVTRGVNQSEKSSTPIRYKLPTLAFSNPAFEDESLRLDESIDSGRENSIVINDNSIRSPGAPSKPNSASYVPLRTLPEDTEIPERDSATSGNSDRDSATSGKPERNLATSEKPNRTSGNPGTRIQEISVTAELTSSGNHQRSVSS